MQPFPHRYIVHLSGGERGDADLLADGLPTLPSAPPPEFDGPAGRWSPEHLLLAAVESCLMMTFRAFARLSKLPFTRLDIDTEGTLNRVDGVTRFTEIVMTAALSVPAGVSVERALGVLERSEQSCLVTASLSTPVRLRASVLVEPAVEMPREAVA